MRLVIAKSTFDHPLEDGETVGPGQPLILEDKLAASLTERLLCEIPRPEVHFTVKAGPTTEDGHPTRLFHRGGGSYLVTSANGVILNEETLRGEENARDYAASLQLDSE